MSRQIYASAIKHVAKTTGLTQRKARAVVEGLFAIAAEAVKYQGRFQLPGVGVFRATTRKARVVRNPVTRELQQLPLTRSVAFRPARRGVFAGGAR